MSIRLSGRQLAALALLTIIWGINWPVMKVGVGHYPPLSFRAVSMWIGAPLLWAVTRSMKVPLTIPRHEWPELAKLAVTNMLIWHPLVVVSLQSLSSGRAAILGYTMPVFSALWGLALFGQRLSPRQVGGVAAAALGIALLLWHELERMAGRPWGAGGMLLAAVVWALGTQQMRHTSMRSPTLAIVFWMTVITMVPMTAMAVVFDHGQRGLPDTIAWASIAFNAVLIFGIAQPLWLVLARALPPIASTLSVMLIPVLGVLSGAWWLGEVVHWQDYAAIGLMVASIASVLLPARAPRDDAQPT